MNRRYGTAIFTTHEVVDHKAGSVGIELHRQIDAEKKCVATLLFWDATGQFAFQTFGEVPLDIVEELITEARITIQIQ
jgi:hypothetical protein